MTGSEKDFYGATPQVKLLSVGKGFDASGIVAERPPGGRGPFRCHPHFRKTSDISRMVPVRMGQYHRDGFVGNAFHYLVEILDGGTGVDKKGTGLSLQKIHGLRSYDVARSHPCPVTEFPENHVRSPVDNFPVKNGFEIPGIPFTGFLSAADHGEKKRSRNEYFMKKIHLTDVLLIVEKEASSDMQK
jgi:hypothetical protein